MTDRSARDTEYVVIRDSKPKKPARYYYDADDDNDSQAATTTRRIIQRKPNKEQGIRYIMSDEHDSDYRRPRLAESSDRGLKIRERTNGEQVVLDEHNNVIKIIRNSRSPTPPSVTHRQPRVRPREPETVYYETSDGHLISRPPPMNHASTRIKSDFIYAEDEPTKIIRKVIIDPRTGDREMIYEKDKPKKSIQQKYVVRKHPTDIPVDSDNEYEQPQQEHPQYVQVVQRRTAPKQEVPSTKYMMIRKKVDSEPMYAVQSSVPSMKNNRRIVYEAPTKKASTQYVYSTNGKYYK